MSTGATHVTNSPLMENVLLQVILTKAAGVLGLQGENVWGRDPQLPLPMCAPSSDQNHPSYRNAFANMV